MQLLLGCEDAPLRTRTALYVQFLAALRAQLRQSFGQVPADIVAPCSNLLVHPGMAAGVVPSAVSSNALVISDVPVKTPNCSIAWWYGRLFDGVPRAHFNTSTAESH